VVAPRLRGRRRFGRSAPHLVGGYPVPGESQEAFDAAGAVSAP
jgi:hypothetical protein